MLSPSIKAVCAKLTTSELFTGILLYTKVNRFTEDHVYQLFREIGDGRAKTKNRFEIRGTRVPSSKPLRRMLSFFTIGNFIFDHPEIPGRDVFTVNQGFHPALKDFVVTELTASEEVALRACAERFDELVRSSMAVCG